MLQCAALTCVILVSNPNPNLNTQHPSMSNKTPNPNLPHPRGQHFVGSHLTSTLTHIPYPPLYRLGPHCPLTSPIHQVTGSAPIAPRVMNFLRAVFGVPVLEGYGQTESSTAISLTEYFDFSLGHVGAPLPCNEVPLA